MLSQCKKHTHAHTFCFGLHTIRLQVDHTHNDLDQRFSAVGTCLQSAPCLEDPDEFRDYLLDNLKPARGRYLHVEVLTATFDFTSWFFQIGSHLQGITPTALQKEVNHSWKFVQRDLVQRLFPTVDAIENQCGVFEGLEEEGGDCIMLVKQFIHSQQLSQAPLLALPAAVAGKLDPNLLKVLFSGIRFLIPAEVYLFYTPVVCNFGATGLPLCKLFTCLFLGSF
jgi:hypothetical protein